MLKLLSHYRQTLSGTVVFAALLTQPLGMAWAGEIEEAVRALTTNKNINEKISLKDLGITQPVSFASSAASRDIYLPVPADTKLNQATLHLKGDYIRADGGRTTYTLAIDGDVVAARALTEPEGATDITIGVDEAPRTSGFVRMGLNWSSIIGKDLCEDDRAIGNVLKISPDSYLSYSYDPTLVTDIASVWSAFPRKVILLVGSDSLDSASYDAAWRLGVALERAGKEVQVTALPQIDSIIDTDGLIIPSALAGIPAFSALAKGGKITLQNEAEIGALLLLNAPILQASIAIADEKLMKGVQSALDSVSSQLKDADPATEAVFAKLYSNDQNLLAPLPEKTINVRNFSGRPLIAVAPDAAADAAGLFDSMWRRTPLANGLILNEIGKPDNNTGSISLGSLNQAANNLDVIARGDWVTTFDLGDSLIKGYIPASLDINVSAAPGATNTPPVASVFINDYLLGAKQLKADGQPELISVDVPHYAILPRNTIRVQFQRQPASDQCRETPQGYPVSVLPDSNMRLKKAGPVDDFATLVPQLAGDALLLVNEDWRENSTKTLVSVISIANAAGLSPSDAEFKLSKRSEPVTPEKPFLSFDIDIKGANDTVKVIGDHVTISDKKGKVFYDASGFSNIAVLQAMTNANYPGLSYSSVGGHPEIKETFMLSGGDVAVIGENGILASVNSAGTPLYLNADGLQTGNGGYFSWKNLTSPAYWMHNFSWLLMSGILIGFFILMALAQIARKRSKNK